MVLERVFFERDTLKVARYLLGKILIHEAPEGVTSGCIVETEAYMGPEDKASHAYGSRRTPRNEVLYGRKGHAYVYQIYGMYFCLNITTGSLMGKPEAVLIRALEPLAGFETMMKRRAFAEKRIIGLTNGPGRLCMALGISRERNGADLCSSRLHIDEGSKVSGSRIVHTKRINVDYADEWNDCSWRFYVSDSEFVCKK